MRQPKNLINVSVFKQEAELRMDVLQQHAAMISGATTTTCPLCHKLIIGTEALIEHMKYSHKDPEPISPVPLSSKYNRRHSFQFS